MDRSSGDGADSAEDSGSSQSYPSTLPGIPKAGIPCHVIFSVLSTDWRGSCGWHKFVVVA